MKCVIDRFIRLKMNIESGNIIIAVQNSFNEPIKQINGLIESSKTTEIENYVFGIKNIIAIVGKYQGNYVITHDNREFLFSILIPIS